MRITGGKFKGRVIKSPPHGLAGVRPTMDALRESLFSILEQYVDWENAHVADLYAGSGSLGLESISRGARNVRFVESNKACAETIRQNVELLIGNCSDDVKIHNSKVIPYLKTIKADLSLVLADPPFGDITMIDFLDMLRKSGAMLPDSIVVFEGDSKNIMGIAEQLPIFLSKGYEVLRVKKYSAAGVCIARVKI